MSFGLFGLVLSPIIGPLFFLCIHPRDKAELKLRNLISFFFRVFLKTMIFLRIVSLRIENLKKIQDSHGLVVCANHPTLIDAVILIAYLPQADCIVKSTHWKNPVTRGIVSRLYIPNNLNAADMQKACLDSLEKGNNILIFPEGTRTPINGPVSVEIKRSASQIALLAKCPVLPIHIQVNKPNGLGKGESILTTPENGRVIFTLVVKNIIKTETYRNYPRPIAARRLTSILKADIFYLEEKK